MSGPGDEQCGTCRFAEMVLLTTIDPDVPGPGETVPQNVCRRYPPAVLPGRDHREAAVAVVTIHPDDWCGEYRPAPALGHVQDPRDVRPHTYGGRGPLCTVCGRPKNRPVPGGEHYWPGEPHPFTSLPDSRSIDCVVCEEGVCHYYHGGCDDDSLPPGVYLDSTDHDGEPLHPDARTRCQHCGETIVRDVQGNWFGGPAGYPCNVRDDAYATDLLGHEPAPG